METKDIESLRADFPMLRQTMHGKPLVYLDSAATAQKPQQVIDAVSTFYSEQYATVLRAIYEIADRSNKIYQGVRETVRRFINAAAPEEIIYTRSATDALNLAAFSLGKALIKEGDTVLVSLMEHHSNFVPWQMMCEERNAHLVLIPLDAHGEIDMAAYKSLLESHHPKIVAVTHISNVLGTVNPIAEMSALARDVGAIIVVDGAQAVSHIPVDVRALGVDLYAFSGHKLYGPTGVGILYGTKALLEVMPPVQGGGSMVDIVTLEKTTYNQVPWKFEAGTMMLAEIAGLGAAIDYLDKVGMETIQRYEANLLDYALKRMLAIEGLHVYGAPRWRESVIAFNVEGIHPLDLGTFLDLQGIAIRTGNHCAQPLLRSLCVNATARLSIGLYNTQEDIDRFCDALVHVIGKLRK